MVDKGKPRASLVADKEDWTLFALFYNLEAGDHICTCYSTLRRYIKCALNPFARYGNRVELGNELS